MIDFNETELDTLLNAYLDILHKHIAIEDVYAEALADLLAYYDDNMNTMKKGHSLKYRTLYCDAIYTGVSSIMNDRRWIHIWENLDLCIINQILCYGNPDESRENKYIFEKAYLISIANIDDMDKKQLYFQHIDRYYIRDAFCEVLKGVVNNDFKEYYLSSEDNVYKNEENEDELIIDVITTDEQEEVCLIGSREEEDKKICISYTAIGEENEIQIRIKTDSNWNERILKLPYCYYYKQYEERINQVEFTRILKMVSEYEQPILSFHYLYCDYIHDIQNQEIDFTGCYNVSIDKEKREIIIANGEQQNAIPEHFFGGKIRNIQAFIGKNGSGKTSVMNLITNCELFMNEKKKVAAKYILIYRYGYHDYYATNFSLRGRDRYTLKKPESLYDHKPSFDTKIVKISNVYNIMDNGNEESENEENNVINLTTQHLIGTHRDESKNRILNYKYIVQENERENGILDRYGNRIIKKGTQIFSSGETARLLIFSRILSVFKLHSKLTDVLGSFALSHNYIFLLDEAELYFHPEWQRTFLKDLCHFINDITADLYEVKNINILLTSNSPFCMSDLPQQCVHVLSRSPKEAMYEEFSQEVFGQNIHTLLKDKFFMNATIGQFAKDKLIEAFGWLENNEEDKLEYLEYMANIIGDPLMKKVFCDKLEEMKKQMS